MSSRPFKRLGAAWWLALLFIGIGPAGSAAQEKSAESTTNRHVMVSTGRADVAVATSRGGVVLRHELDRWLECAPKARSRSLENKLKRFLIERALRKEFDEKGLGSSTEFQWRKHHLERRLAQRALRRAISASSTPTDTEVQDFFQQHRQKLHQPKRWRLQNLFKRFQAEASDEEREHLRRTMAAIRQRLLDGEDFSELAASESDSRTRVRGGRLGLATLRELQPEVAEVVATLEVGQLSTVIETDDGLTLLYCTQIVDAVTPDLDDLRPRLERRLRQERFEEAWAELESQLETELGPVLQPAATPSEAVVRWRKGSGLSPILKPDFDLFLKEKAAHPSQPLSTDRRRELLRERWLLEAQAFEARRRGVIAGPEIRSELACRLAQLEARSALEAASLRRFKEPSQLEITQALEASGNLQRPRRSHLKVLELAIDRGRSREFYGKVRELGEKAHAGELSFEELVQEIGPDGGLRDMGSMTDEHIWQLGRSVQVAADSLEVGQTSPVVQEGQRLLILHLIGREPARPLTESEARTRIRAGLLERRQRQARAAVRRRILENENLELVTP
ncbi:MAG: peptidylprolyl isomerase [Acidobacteriota bacterium]